MLERLSETLTRTYPFKGYPRVAPNFFYGGGVEQLGGLNLFPAPEPGAKISLGPKAPVSEAFREEFDAWLLERFGRRDPILGPDKIIISEAFGFAVVPRETIDLLKKKFPSR
jgi:hypothetical protein